MFSSSSATKCPGQLGYLLLLITTSTMLPAQQVVNTPQNPQAYQSPSQVSPVFDVISIHPSDPNTNSLTINSNPNNFRMTGVTVGYLIKFAYHLHEYQIDGLPGWATAKYFDIHAKMDATANGSRPATQKTLDARLQSLLTDRFRLSIHVTLKERDVYVLVAANGGPTLTSTTEATNTFVTSPGLYKCSDCTMSDLAYVLSESEDRVVIDRTNIKGKYAFNLRWDPDLQQDSDTDVPSLYTAIQQQLGLKLIRSKGPVDVVTIDHIEEPSKN